MNRFYRLKKVSWLGIVVVSIVLFACKTKQSVSNLKSSSKYQLSENLQLEFDRDFYTANKEKLVGNLEQAANLFSKCTQINPYSAAANYELANIYFSQNRTTEAILFSKKAADLEEKNTWYQLLYAQCLLKDKKIDEAAKIFERLTKNYPDRADFYFEHANALIYAGKFEQAITAYDKLEKQIGINENVSNSKKQLYLKLNKLDKAIAEVQKLIDSNPKEPRYYGLMAELYMANNQLDKAFEQLKKVLEVDPTNANAHLALADYYREKKQNDKAFQELKAAFENPDLDIDTKVKILLSYYNVTETALELKSQAYELIDVLVKVHPKDARSYFIQGDFLYRDKRTKEAAEAFSKGLQYDKEKFPGWNQLILIYSELNDTEKMYTTSKEALELFPNQASLFLYNGVACMQLKKYKEAIEVLKQGVGITVDNNPLLNSFYMYLGDAYHAEKDNKNSDENYDKALKIEPNNVYVLNNYAYYLSERTENLDKAAEMSNKTLTLEPTVGNYQDTYAWILYKQKKYEDAKVWQEKAVNNGGGENGVMLEHLGDIYFQLNNVDKALEYWEKAKGKDGVSKFLEQKIKEKKLYE